jgi:hypothetical protein
MIIHRPNSSIALLAASVLVASAALIAQAPPPKAPPAPAAQNRPPAPEEYTGTTVNMASGAGINLSIQVLRWSADADRDKVVAAVTGPADKEADLGKTLQEVPTVGYIWTGGSLGYTLKYAHRQTLPDGTEQVVLMTDRPLGSWDRTGPWKASAGATEPERPFTILELRVNKAGIGQGKMSLSTPFAPDEKTKALALVNYGAATVLLKDVKHKPAPRQSSMQ